MILATCPRSKLQGVLWIGLFLFAGMEVVLQFPEHFRLHADDLTTHRREQWELLGTIFAYLPLWGLGDYGSEAVMATWMDFAFHASLVRVVLGFGLAGIWVVLMILITYIYGWIAYIRNKSKINFICILIMTAGMICSFSEPNPIIVTSYWPLWWIAAGHFFGSGCRKVSGQKPEEDSETEPSMEVPVRPMQFINYRH